MNMYVICRGCSINTYKTYKDVILYLSIIHLKLQSNYFDSVNEAHAAWLVKWVYLASPSGYTTYACSAVCLEVGFQGRSVVIITCIDCHLYTKGVLLLIYFVIIIFTIILINNSARSK